LIDWCRREESNPHLLA